MPPVGFEPTISAGERPKTYALDPAATGTDFCFGIIVFLILSFLQILAERRQKFISLEINFATVFCGQKIMTVENVSMRHFKDTCLM